MQTNRTVHHPESDCQRIAEDLDDFVELSLADLGQIGGGRLKLEPVSDIGHIQR